MLLLLLLLLLGGWGSSTGQLPFLLFLLLLLLLWLLLLLLWLLALLAEEVMMVLLRPLSVASHLLPRCRSHEKRNHIFFPPPLFQLGFLQSPPFFSAEVTPVRSPSLPPPPL